MAITKTDFMRGMQCRKMLWLDRHKPGLRVIPPEVQVRLDAGNAFVGAEISPYYDSLLVNMMLLLHRLPDLLPSPTQMVAIAAATIVLMTLGIKQFARTYEN